MDNRLRTALERRGLPADSSDRDAQDFFAKLTLDEKGKVGVEVGREAYGHGESEPLVTRDDPQRDLTLRGFFLRADSADESDRSVEATIATDEPVAVYDYRTGRVIDEVLRMDGMEAGEQVPLLDNHYRYSLDDVYGSTRQIRIEDGKAVARLFFADGDERIERAWQKVLKKHLRDVSAGYRVLESTDIPPGEIRVVNGRSYTAGGRTLRVSTRWQLKEVSLVPIGADERSKIRGQHLHEQESSMPPQLRAYLESIGLRSDASDGDAWRFYGKLQNDQRTRADQLKGDAQPPADQGQQQNQRSDPPASPPTPPAPPAQGQQRSEAPANPPAQPVSPEEAARQAIAAERDRVRQLEDLAGADVPSETLRQAIREGWDVARASREFLTAFRAGRTAGAQQAVPYHASTHTGPTTAPSVRAMAAGLMLGCGVADPTKYTMHNGRRDPGPTDRLTAQDAEAGQRMSRLSMVDLVRMCVHHDTGRMAWDIAEAFEMARTAPSGGTLAYVFSTNVYARLLAGWATVGDTTVGWCDEEDVPNFLQQEDISLSANARLQRLPRGDTAKHATVSDSHETYKIGRYANQFVMDEQDVLDDRLGALMRMPTEMGEAARQLRPDLVYSLILENAAMSDTGTVFNATAVTTTGGHANLGTGALSSGALKTAISAMVKQRLNRTASDPGRQLVIRPRFLIVPAALEWTARELTAAAALAKLFADSSDPYYAQLNLLAQEGLRVVPDDRVGAIGVLDPRTGSARAGTDTNWFLTQGGSRGLRVAYRRGTNRQPVMRSFVLDKGQWGLGWDINLDIGAVFTEWRTWYKSTGAVA